MASFRLQDGQEEWITQDLPGHAGYHIYPTLDNNRLKVYVVTLPKTTVYDIDVQNGQIVATHDFSTDVNVDLVMATSDSKYLDTPQGLMRVDNQQDTLWLVPTTAQVGKMVFSGAPLETNHSSEYWLASGDCGLLAYFGDSQELIAFWAYPK